MGKYIDKDVLVEAIRKRLLPVVRDKHYDEWEEGQDSERIAILNIIDTLEVKEVDLELITGWFDHVAQMADDRKTLNGEVMEDWAALDEIKCLAKNSSEFITKHYKAQKGE